MPVPKSKRRPSSRSAVQRERERVAQALHDTFCQELTGIGLLVNATTYRFRQLCPETEQPLNEIADLLQRANRELSAFMRELREGQSPDGRSAGEAAAGGR